MRYTVIRLLQASLVCATLSYNKGFYFELHESKIVKDNRHYTSISIISKRIQEKEFLKIITNSFYLQPNYKIMYNNSLLNPYSKTYDPIIITKDTSHVTFEDEAIGISISVFLTKLLIPSISTKTISKSLTKDLTYSGPRTDIIIGEVLDDELSRFMINMRGISLYTHVIYKKSIEDLTKGSSSNIIVTDKENIHSTFILTLPDQTPLPVSRDDVILTDPVFYNAARENILRLVDLSIDRLPHLDNLFDHLRVYSEYANDINVYKLVNEANDYLLNKEGIYTIPKGNTLFFNKIVMPITRKKYVAVDLPNTNRLTDHLLSIKKFKTIEAFTNKTTLLIEGLVRKIEIDHTTAGLAILLFVDENYSNTTNWKAQLMIKSTAQLYTPIATIPDDILKIYNDILHDLITTLGVYNHFKKYIVMIEDYMRRMLDVLSTMIQRQKMISWRRNDAISYVYVKYY